MSIDEHALARIQVLESENAKLQGEIDSLRLRLQVVQRANALVAAQINEDAIKDEL